jgi:hypothetical protein
MELTNRREKEPHEAAVSASALAEDEPEETTESELIAVIMRQQELIVRQTEQLLRAMETMLSRPMAGKPSKSLRGEVDEILTALAGITPRDMALVADFARMMFDTIKGTSVVGGGAVAGAS